MAATTLKLQSKVAIVTGAARGIGLACARVLAKNGAKVVLADIDEAEAQAAAGRMMQEGMSAHAIKCDVRHKSEVDAMITDTVAWGGRLDIMVANAGIVRAAPFLEMSEKDFDDVLAVNLKGVFLCCQAAARQMVAQRQQAGQAAGSAPAQDGGAIITMSSVNALMAIPSIAGYNASKGGVNGLTRNMALALASHGIRVNGVGPGSIATDVLASVANDQAAMARIMSRTPMGRIGDPEEIANVVNFLASSDSSYITGQIIYADGGRLALNYTV
uniref:Ketoreductase domain-containing protein n=1 Tax=Chlamydomonas leiostraca TaxID=1034604 RepID=A0A7S0RWB7_9CHLO|eukprot:CAMPEP_0202869686 /NCGR_PEP_ID=MMETSP1391-20130828/12591_1 /ASSEMBLY_ACC=CAM_ASM_000867 /TAXON_ID=1034604 /ORGANISM="Chlamydomonas leiostraca, Strain SAG 11-49" /LENGTH=272 /DNA_ID=CAMNT_0049550029 /DNA_START=70 /DNA_END=888 /DNA_ORIENTATION=+